MTRSAKPAQDKGQRDAKAGRGTGAATLALLPDPANPNRMDAETKAAMARSLAEFGDISGCVVNRRTGLLIGGHQRADVLRDGVLHVADLPAPEADGTVARGYIECNGRRYAVRVVDWPEDKAHKGMGYHESKGGDSVSLIYEPKGKAREYSPLALNVYSGGCDHQCRYCYCPGIMRGAWGATAQPRNLSGLAREAATARRQILLCFMSDPYCAADVQHGKTREALTILRDAGCSVAILTKGGARCLRDLDLFTGWPGGRVKVGATLTFNASALSRDWEPGAADPGVRVEALRQLHAAGVKTWASIEPVIDPVESLAVIEASLPYVDAYKVGRWNHDARANAIDWPAFGKAAVDTIRAAGKRLYVKVDLRPHFPAGYLRPEECETDALTLPDRPNERTLL